MDRFIRGLKPAIRKEVELRDPADLSETIRLAERADSVEYRLRGNNFSNRNSFRPPPIASNGPVPMELGSMSASTSANGRNRNFNGDGQRGRSKDYSNITC